MGVVDAQFGIERLIVVKQFAVGLCQALACVGSGITDVAVDAVDAVVRGFLSQLVSLVNERLHLFQLFSQLLHLLHARVVMCFHHRL